MEILEYSLILNIILLFSIFSPNIVYLIHKQHFNWKKPKFINNQSINSIKNVFTVGDTVKITNNIMFDEDEIYYLLEEYNGGEYWYVSTNRRDTARRSLTMGVHISSIKKI